MSQQSVKVNLPDGKTGDGTQVPILESVERWSEIKLEDGSVLRVKPNVIAVARVNDQWDGSGNPIYAVRTQDMIVVASAPEELRRPTVIKQDKVQ